MISELQHTGEVGLTTIFTDKENWSTKRLNQLPNVRHQVCIELSIKARSPDFASNYNYYSVGTDTAPLQHNGRHWSCSKEPKL